MKLALEYPVDATIHIGSIIHVAKQDKEYILIPNEEGALKAIRIVVTITNPSEVISKIKPGGQEVQATIIIDIGRTIRDELIAEFQELESILSFSTSGALRKIIWSKPKQEFIPETEDESVSIDITSFQLESGYPRKWAKLDKPEFGQLVNTKAKYSSLVIPKSFYREGLIEYEELRYINAFHNFYYILEDLYGGGKTK